MTKRRKWSTHANARTNQALDVDVHFKRTILRATAPQVAEKKFESWFIHNFFGSRKGIFIDGLEMRKFWLNSQLQVSAKWKTWETGENKENANIASILNVASNLACNDLIRILRTTDSADEIVFLKKLKCFFLKNWLKISLPNGRKRSLNEEKNF